MLIHNPFWFNHSQMPSNSAMEGYFPFRGAILLLWADCIRVTHPYATLGQVLLLNLPFGLHVLGLPLAFILSQDQTLHSIILTNFPLALPVSRVFHFLPSGYL